MALLLNVMATYKIPGLISLILRLVKAKLLGKNKQKEKQNGSP
jgi:hypothetical protein